MKERKLGITTFLVTGGLLAVAASFWFLQIYGMARPEVAPIGAPATAFSAARAEQVLARILGSERPHPVSSDENAVVRARVLAELAALDVPAQVFSSFACHSPHDSSLLICATVKDIVAEVKPGPGRAIVLLAHYDSVPAGPGAADDESGVATVIETARALKARGFESRHPILAVLTDGEEADLLGAAAFLRDPALKARVGAVVNVEARGNQGPSLLFQTSPGDGPLIDLYANNVPNYATSSLYHEIYRFLPNDTDLTLFIGDGFPSFNFAYVGGVADYHTALDRRANLDPVSLQQQGDNMLGVASGLERVDFASLRGRDDIYLDLLGRTLPRVPVVWALPLALAAFLLLLTASLLSRGTAVAWPQWLAAFAVTPAFILVAVGSGFLLHGLASLVSGMPDPSYAHPAALRIALALGLGGGALLVSRLAAMQPAAAAAWMWLSALGIVAAILVPGLSPYFLIPTSVAGVTLLIAARVPGSWNGTFGVAALLVSALVALLGWSAIGTSGEALMGLKLHPLFTVPFALGLSTLVPLLSRFRIPHAWWARATATLFVTAFGAAIVQGLEPAYSPTVPQRLNVTYVEDSGRHRAWWAVDAVAPVPDAMRAIASFSSRPERISRVTPPSYVAPAGAPRLASPTATVLGDVHTNGVRLLTIALHGSDRAAQMFLVIPKAAMLESIDLHGWHFEAPSRWGDDDSVVLACMSRDCSFAEMTLTIATRAPVTLGLYEQRFGLPDFAQRLVAARPPAAVPSQNGDGVLLVGGVRVPMWTGAR